MVEIAVSELSHEFDDREVFRALSFSHAGGCLAVTGPNASGKSTLLRILAGLLTPASGEVRLMVDGREVGREAMRDVIGLAAPDVRLYPELTARENLRFLLAARGHRADEKHIAESLASVGLDGRADDPISGLSSGLRQRASLAAAIVHGPAVLLLDEPTTNLDEAGIAVVRSLVESRKSRGMVVVATNDPEEARLGDALVDLGSAQ